MKLNRTHVFPFTINFDLLDAGKALHHPNYLVVFERARAAALRLAGYSDMELWKAGYALTVAHIESQFLKPVLLGENVTVLTRLIEAGAATMAVHQSMIPLSEEHKESFVESYSVKREFLIHECSIKLCCVNLEKMRPRRFPQELVRALELEL